MRRGIVFFMILLFPAMASGNGGPINETVLRRMGNIELMQRKDILLDREVLDIALEAEYATVHAVYTLVNKGKATAVTYGFPIDWELHDLYSWSDIYADLEESIQDFIIEDDGGRLKTVTIEEYKDPSSLDLTSYPKARKWFITELHFAGQETKRLEVRYRVKNFYEVDEYSNSIIPVYGDRIFHYTLRPAKSWGSGIVDTLTIRVDTRKILKMGGAMKSIKPSGYHDREGLLTWNWHTFDLGKAGDIEAVYEVNDFLLQSLLEKEYLPPDKIVALRTSSRLAGGRGDPERYGAAHLIDGDLATTWAEGVPGNGEGEWIEVEFAPKTRVFVIGLVNGYTRNKAVYEANNRVKKVRLEQTWADGYIQEREVRFDDRPFETLNQALPYSSCMSLIDALSDIGIELRRIRITILEVYPGTKYDDTCISELYIFGREWDLEGF